MMDRQPDETFKGDDQIYFQKELRQIVRELDDLDRVSGVPAKVLSDTAFSDYLPSVSMTVRIGNSLELHTDWIFDAIKEGSVLIDENYNSKVRLKRTKERSLGDIGFNDITQFETSIVWPDDKIDGRVRVRSDYVRDNKGSCPDRISSGKVIIGYSNVDYFAYRYHNDCPMYRRRFFYLNEEDIENGMSGGIGEPARSAHTSDIEVGESLDLIE